jgi:hypothetical protein
MFRCFQFTERILQKYIRKVFLKALTELDEIPINQLILMRDTVVTVTIILSSSRE